MIASFKRRFFWQPDAEQFSEPLRTAPPFKLRIDRFPRGVDNTHIDVVLSPRFMQHAIMLVRNSLQHELAINYWGESRSAPDAESLHLLREAYVGMMELAVDRARGGSRPELI